MASEVCLPVPFLFRHKSGRFEATKSFDASKNQKEVAGLTLDSSCGWAGNYILMMELRKKILTFRDVIDLPPRDGSGPINELVMGTVEDLHKLYPRIVPSIPASEINITSLHQGLAYFYNSIKALGDSWTENHKWLVKFKYDKDGNMENIGLEQFGKRVLEKLDYTIKVAKEIFDVMDEEEQKNENNPREITYGDVSMGSYKENKFFSRSPVTPTSILSDFDHGTVKVSEFADVSYSSPLLWSLRLQAVGKLKPMDVKRLSFRMFSHVSAEDSSTLNQRDKTAHEANNNFHEANTTAALPMTVTNEGLKNCETKDGTPHIPKPDSNMMNSNMGSNDKNVDSKPNMPPLPLPPPMTVAGKPTVASSPPPPLLPKSNVTATPPPPSNRIVSAAPPPMFPSKVSLPTPPSPMPLTKGAAPPPPPPLGVTKALRPKKANTKLKRSTHMGNLYRLLKGKLEGSCLDGKSSHGRKNQIGSSASGKQGMADALAEMTKRSAYFQQIEEDVQKHAKSIMEMKAAINSFQTKDMAELLKFHKYMEHHLENLTDESQVLSRFEGFPSKKLETLRTAAALYTKLDAIAANLQSWKIVAPLGQLLDKFECYFNKIKGEVDALERSKDEESKRFQAHNIHFDFNILVKIKELIVDVSSSCMELALKERREAKAEANGKPGPKTEGRSKASVKLLWRAFQLAFRVYTFAGGHDDRADRLTKELAQEIETDPHH